jgi:hypothetical protein
MPTPSPAGDDSNFNIELDTDDLASEPDPSLVTLYTEYLYTHNNEVRSHILGKTESGPLESKPSYFAPNTCWTAQEKDRFFHALAVRSRLRPDLIAEDIGTKSLAEVCTYLNMLEESLSQRKKLYGSATGNNVPDSYLVLRDHFPIALEVSEKWEEYEGTLAEVLIAKEPKMVAESIQRARSEEIQERANKIRVPWGRGRRADNTRDREGEKARKKMLKEWLSEREEVWQKEDVLNAMDAALMRAIDMLVRESEETRALASEDDTSKIEENDAVVSQDQPTRVAAVSADAFMNGMLPLADIEDELIDPSLRESSNAPTRVQTSLLDESNRCRTPEPSAANPHDNFNPVTPPFAHLEPPATSPVTLVEPEQDDASVADSIPREGEVLLSPASRRRLRKRMYMRRKRAETGGGAVDQSTVRLKPGRKSAKASGDDDKPARHPHPSGKTLTYKMQEELKKAGITPEWLQAENLDLFHMHGLYKLMRYAFAQFLKARLLTCCLKDV